VNALRRLDEFLLKIDELFEELERLTDKRELMLKATRDVLKYARDVINYSIIGKLEKAKKCLNELRETKNTLMRKIEDEPRLKYSGNLRDTLKEYVEAELVFNFALQYRSEKRFTLPDWKELNVSVETYILGLFDFIGELKRILMKEVKQGDIDRAWAIFEIMQALHTRFEGKIILNSIVPGYKSKVDSIRRLLINTEEFLIKIESESNVIRALREKDGEENKN